MLLDRLESPDSIELIEFVRRISPAPALEARLMLSRSVLREDTDVPRLEAVEFLLLPMIGDDGFLNCSGLETNRSAMAVVGAY